MDFPIIDSHIHLLDPARFSYGWTSGAPSLNRQVLPEDLYETAQPVEIEKFVFVEVDVDLPQHVAEAEWIDGLSQTDPRLAGQVACLPLELGSAVAPDLEKLLALKSFRAVRRLIQNQADPDFCVRPDFIAGLKLLAPHDIAFDICVFHHHLPNVIKMVEACPEVRFVLDHIAKPAIKAGLMEPWKAHMAELARFENVWCKISGVATEADHQSWTREQLTPYIAHAIEVFGFGRAMFGGDWHVSELAIRYPEWVALVEDIVAGASADEKRNLFRNNAASFYRLDN